MKILPISYSVGDKVTVSGQSLANVNTSNRCTGVQWFTDEFKEKLRGYVGKVATVTHRFPPGYEMTIEFQDGQAFHVKDNWILPCSVSQIERLNTYAVFLNVETGRERVEIDAPSIYDAISLAERKHGGKLWQAYETAESQARH
jgi:hypothetical protein